MKLRCPVSGDFDQYGHQHGANSTANSTVDKYGDAIHVVILDEAEALLGTRTGA